MANYRTRRFIPVALIVIIIVIAIIGLVYLARVMFFSSNSTLIQADTSRESLLSTAADRAVRLKVRGNIVADEDFRSYQIQITPNERILALYKGYEKQEFDNITLDNNIPAYEQLVYALNRARMMNNSELTGESNDTRGICASGLLYEFQILKADKVLKSLWTTSCNRPRGSLGVSLAPLTSLFTVQISGAQTKINGLWQ